MAEGEIVQRIHEEVTFNIEEYEEEDEVKIRCRNRIYKPFDLNQAPLLRVGLIKIAEERHILMFDMHHIISDGVSMGILIKEFSRYITVKTYLN